MSMICLPYLFDGLRGGEDARDVGPELCVEAPEGLQAAVQDRGRAPGQKTSHHLDLHQR